MRDEGYSGAGVRSPQPTHHKFLLGPASLFPDPCKKLFNLQVISSHSKGIKSQPEGIQVLLLKESSTFMLFRCRILCEIHVHAYVAMNITWFSKIQVNFVIFKCSTA